MPFPRVTCEAVSYILLIITLISPLVQGDCLVGPELLPDPLSNVGSYLQIFTSIRFPCSGKVVRWNYYSRSRGTPVYFGAWEAINSTTFRLVDYNRVIPNATGLQHEEILDPTEFVSVTPGLYLGIHYDSIDIPQDRQVIPYADAVKPQPYTVLGLADGFPVGVGHSHIVQSKGYISFTGILFKNWRLPALQASVKFLVDCGKPPVVPASKVTYKTTLAFSTAVYQCNSGHRLIGSPISTCQSSGMWSPPPICDINDLCFAGPELYNHQLDSASSLLQLFPGLQFQCGGFVGRWWFYSLSPGRTVYLSVWRQNGGKNSVQIIGSNKILAANKGLNYFRVPEDDMILVEPGDFIGIFYERPDLSNREIVVPYAGEHNLKPYTASELTETLLLPMGKLAIGASNGEIDLSKHADGAVAYWRIPAFRGYVINVPVCSQPPMVAYATIAYSSTKVNAVAVYSCVQGYTLYGQNPIKCLSTQKWSGSPECRLIPRCEKPPTVANALAYFNSTAVGSQVTYFCKAGWVVKGPNPVTCLTNITWSLPLPECYASSACPPPPVIVNGQLTMQGTLQPRGAVAFYSCKEGFVMVGASSAFCTNDKSWSSPPSCSPAMHLPKPGQRIHGIGGATGPVGWGRLTRPPTQLPPQVTGFPPGYLETPRSPSQWGDWSQDYYKTTAPPCRGSCGGSRRPGLPADSTSFVTFNVPTDKPSAVTNPPGDDDDWGDYSDYGDTQTEPPDYSDYDGSRTDPPDYSDYGGTQTEPPDYSDYGGTQTEPPDYSDYGGTQTEPPDYSDYGETQTEPPDYSDYGGTRTEPPDYSDYGGTQTEPPDYSDYGGTQTDPPDYSDYGGTRTEPPDYSDYGGTQTEPPDYSDYGGTQIDAPGYSDYEGTQTEFSPYDYDDSKLQTTPSTYDSSSEPTPYFGEDALTPGPGKLPLYGSDGRADQLGDSGSQGQQPYDPRYQNQPGYEGGYQNQNPYGQGYPTQTPYNGGYQTQPGYEGGYQNQNPYGQGYPTQTPYNGGYQTQPGYGGGYQNQPPYGQGYQTQTPYGYQPYGGQYPNQGGTGYQQTQNPYYGGYSPQQGGTSGYQQPQYPNKGEYSTDQPGGTYGNQQPNQPYSGYHTTPGYQTGDSSEYPSTPDYGGGDGNQQQTDPGDYGYQTTQPSYYEPFITRDPSDNSDRQVDSTFGYDYETETTVTPIALHVTTSNTSTRQITDGTVLVLTDIKDPDTFAATLVPAAIVPVIIISLIVSFAILFAWLRYKKGKRGNADASIYYSGQPFYENVKHGGQAANESMATGYVRGSQSGSGISELGPGAALSEHSISESEDVVTPIADLTQVKRQPNFFMATTNSGLAASRSTLPRHSATAVVPPPPPPPPLPPPPAYKSEGIAVTTSSGFYARRNDGTMRASTLQRQRFAH